jgi:hypothetical protein
MSTVYEPDPWRAVHGSRDLSLNEGGSILDGHTRLKHDGVRFPGRRK